MELSMVYVVKVSKGKTSMFTKLEREPTMELCTAMHCHALPYKGSFRWLSPVTATMSDVAWSVFDVQGS